MSKAPLSEWFEAARRGNDEITARLLTEWPELASTADSKGFTALDYAAQGGYDKLAAQLLAASPSVIERVIRRVEGMNALHSAAAAGHDKVVAQLLAVASPSLIATTSQWGRTALAYAAINNREKVFLQLLAASPQLLDEEVLISAVERRNDDIVDQILALRPDLVSKRNRHGWTGLRSAVDFGHDQMAEKMLAIDPKQALDDSTLLFTSVHNCSREFVEKLWRMNPAALHAESASKCPFQRAVAWGRDDLVELFQWSVSFDELASAFTAEWTLFETRYRPVIEEQCECLLLLGSLNRDVLTTVFEYLGFEPHTRTLQPPSL